MIYFIKSESGYIQIGYSRSPTQRLENLQTSNPDKLILLGTISGGRDKEADLHERFAHLRCGNEWFKADQELLEYIEHNKENLPEEERITIPDTSKEILIIVGNNIRLARLRRGLTLDELADSMGVGRRALMNIEYGYTGASIGNYLQALIHLGLQKEFEQIAAADSEGRKLQDDLLLQTRGCK